MKRFARVFAGCFLLAASCYGDGGALLLQKQAGSLLLSVFGSPEPLRPGPADLSVMLQNAADHSSILDAKVHIRLRQTGAGAISELYAPATHERATNKLLYAAKVTLPAEGAWQLAVDAETKSQSAEIAGEIHVAQRQAPIVAYWPYFAVIPLIGILFVINGWLRGKRRSARLPAQR